MRWIALLLLVGCVQPDTPPKKKIIPSVVTDGFNSFPTQGTLRYFLDPRTSLCFAIWWGGDWRGGPGMAHVPCSRTVDLIDIE